jgi:outer membrane protein assembly factor BamB
MGFFNFLKNTKLSHNIFWGKINLTLMKTKFVYLIILCIILISNLPNHAQTKAVAAWKAKFTSPINWQRVHALGYIIVSTNEALYGVDPNTGSILWTNKNLASLNPESYQEVEGTEFVTITSSSDKESTLPMQTIIEVVAGKVLFDSRQEKIGILSRHVLPSSGRLLIIGAKQGTLSATLFMYDIATGKQLWMNDELFKPQPSERKGLLGSLEQMAGALGSLQSLTGEPVELQDQTMIITHPNFVIRINSADGKVIWKNSVLPSKRAAVYFSPYQRDMVYVGTEVESKTGSTMSSSTTGKTEPQKYYENYYYGFNLKTGQPAWSEPAKEKDQLNKVIPHEKGLIICPRSSQKPTINLVDYSSGKTVWGNKGKGVKAQGSVVSHIITQKGILITTAFDNAWNNKAEEYYLNLLDPASGTLKYEKAVKLKGDLVRSELVSKGLLFVTTKEVNILDPTTGILVMEKSIESGNNGINNDKPRPFPTAEKNGLLYIYSAKDKAVYELDKNAGVAKVITKEKLEFEGKELPKSIDAKEDGLVLSSDQNITKLGYDGTVKYMKYYPAPRQPALMRALLAAEAVRAAYIGAASSAYAAAFNDAANKTTDPTGKAMGQGLSKGFSELGQSAFNYSSQAMKQFSARYKASQNTPDFVMMMTRQEKKGYQLIQVSKANGEVLNAVDIKNDKEPEYEVDQIYNHVYYRPSGLEIVCYKL